MSQESEDIKVVRYILTTIVALTVIAAVTGTADTALKRHPGCGATIYKAEDP